LVCFDSYDVNSFNLLHGAAGMGHIKKHKNTSGVIAMLDSLLDALGSVLESAEGLPLPVVAVLSIATITLAAIAGESLDGGKD
jgi:hypothetical protein